MYVCVNRPDFVDGATRVAVVDSVGMYLISVKYMDTDIDDGQISGSQVLGVSDAAAPMEEVVAAYKPDTMIPVSIHDE